MCGGIVDEYTTAKERNEVFKILAELSDVTEVFYVFGNHDTGKYSFLRKNDLVKS